AEDGIRGFHVTGVQTCALPISLGAQLARATAAAIRMTTGVNFISGPPAPRIGAPLLHQKRAARVSRPPLQTVPNIFRAPVPARRSEERRVGKESRRCGGPGEAW